MFIVRPRPVRVSPRPATYNDLIICKLYSCQRKERREPASFPLALPLPAAEKGEWGNFFSGRHCPMSRGGEVPCCKQACSREGEALDTNLVSTSKLDWSLTEMLTRGRPLLPPSPNRKPLLAELGGAGRSGVLLEIVDLFYLLYPALSFMARETFILCPLM